MKRCLLSLMALAITTLANAQSEIYPQHFNLKEITITGGPLKTAEDLNIQHLLSYDVDRLLTPFVTQAGLSNTTDKNSQYYQWTTKHPNHPNWGGDSGFDLSGHVGGHYLTALSLAYAASHNEETKTVLRNRIDYMLRVMKDCQDVFDSDQTGLYGFIGGQPIKANWQALYKGDTNGFWNNSQAVPFYCQHKVLAGLRDAALYTEDDADFARATIAREMFRKLCDWSINLVAKLNEDQMQGVLNTEHGGMNETLIDAYHMFSDSKYLTAAKKYSHKTMINNMQSLNTSFLDGWHANTQVPKNIGFIRIAQEDATATSYKTAAKNFWTDVTTNRTVCIGGNSVNEHFFAASNGMNYMNELDGPESCNTNNMLKLSEDLFDTFHDACYADFYEGAMYNHILSTQDPTTGGYVYFTPLRPQSYRIYSKPNQDMWCCVGTGMENHVKYGHFTYTHKDDVLYVNLFTPSTLVNERFALTQETNFPYEQGTRLIIDKDGDYTLAIRKPKWVADGFAVSLNGTNQDVSGTKAESYYLLTASFKKGDVVKVDLPMALRYEPCPNLNDYIAFKYGPILLGARTTKVSESDDNDLPFESLYHEYAAGERMGHSPGANTQKLNLSTMPMLIGKRGDVLSRITTADASKLIFSLDVSRDDETSQNYAWTTLRLEPYYTLHHSRVSNYFYQQDYETYMQSSWAQEEKAAAALAERTIDQVDMGKQQSEAGVVTFSGDSSRGTHEDEDYRDTKSNGWIQVVLQDTVDNATNLSLMLRYTTDDAGRKCKIYVNGNLLKDYTVPSTMASANSNGFYDLELPLENLAYDKDGNRQTKFTVRIVASSTTANPGLYYIRLMKDYPTYKFQAADWGFTGDEGRVAQSKISVNTTDNTIKMRQSGTNNICLRYGSSNNYQVPLDHKYLVIRGTNLMNGTANGYSYLWWLNCKNVGSQVAPTKSKKLADGRIQLAWDITTSGLDANCKTDPWTLSSASNSASTLFGLTAANTAKDVVISYIGFMNEAQLNGTEPEPEGDMTAVETPTEDACGKTYYMLNGMAAKANQHGIYIARNANGNAHKVVR